MEINEIRRRNLWAKVHPHGYSDQGVKSFAEKSGKTEQRIRHLIAKDPDTVPAKNIGSASAREFEKVLSLPNGWMDEKHPELWHDISEFRKSRLREMVEYYGSNGALSDYMLEEPDYVDNLLKETTVIDAELAREIESKMNFPENWLDTDEIGGYKNVVKEAENSKYITIQQYKDVRGAMGKGAYLLDTEGEVIDWRVTPDWARTKLPANTGIDNLRIITGLGDSMKGLYNSGDPLIVDIGINAVDFDAVYFFRVGDEGYVKRLQKTPNGILVISKNPDYRDWIITKDMDLEIFGRVLKVWEGKDL